MKTLKNSPIWELRKNAFFDVKTNENDNDSMPHQKEILKMHYFRQKTHLCSYGGLRAPWFDQVGFTLLKIESPITSKVFLLGLKFF